MSAPAEPRPLGAVALSLAGIALLAVGAELAGLEVLRRVAATPIVLWGAAMPLLVLASPVPPALFKVGVLALPLAPLVTAVATLSLGALVGPARAPAATLVLLALLLAVAARRPVQRAPLGRSAWLGLATGAALAGLVALVVLRPDHAPPGSARDLWSQGLSMAVLRGLPPEHPWLAGAPVATSWTYEAAVASIARASGWSTWTVPALWTVGAALAMPPAAFLAAATVWPDVRSTALAALIVAVGWGLVPGLVGLARSTTPTLGSLGGLAALGPLAPALALATAGWASAVHGLRHGARPWVELCGLFFGGTLLLHPPLGVGALAGVALAALVVPDRAEVRPRMLLALLIGALPGLVVVRTLGWAPSPSGVQASWSLGQSALDAAALLGLLLVLGLPGLLRSRSRGRTEPGVGPRRRLVGGLLVAALVPWILAAVGPAAGGSPAAVRWTGIPIALLAAGAAGTALAGGGPTRRVAGALAVLVPAAGAVSMVAGALGARSADAGPQLVRHEAGAFVRGDRELVGRPPLDDAVWHWLREELAFRDESPVLIQAPVQVPVVAGIDDDPDPAALLADLSLWCDRRVWPDTSHPRWSPRRTTLVRLFRDLRGRDADDAALVRELARLERPAVALVRATDEEHNRHLVTRLRRLGFAPLAHFADARLLVWPPELAPASRAGEDTR